VGWEGRCTLIWEETNGRKESQHSGKLHRQILGGRILVKICSKVCSKIGLGGVDRFSWMNDLGGIMGSKSINYL
jgi:hypothetical protein